MVCEDSRHKWESFVIISTLIN